MYDASCDSFFGHEMHFIRSPEKGHDFYFGLKLTLCRDA
jgi:hypothetical protein